MIEKGYFHVELGQGEVLDLADISKEEWRKIDDTSKLIMNADQTKNAKIAFVAAFLHFVMQKQELQKPFDMMN